MPTQFFSISQPEAFEALTTILKKASDDNGGPVAIAVTDCAGRLLAFTAMDGITPACVKLAQSKAYSAVMGGQDTIGWARKQKSPQFVDFDMRNWTDENFTGFTGGVAVKFQGKVIGGIGVSGRKGAMDENDTLLQDNELANLGRTLLDGLYKPEPQKSES